MEKLNGLQAVVISLELSDKISLVVTQLVPHLASLSRETKLFETQQTVLDSVTAYFTQIIVVLVKAREHLGRSKLQRLFKAPFANEFDEAVETLEGCAKQVAEELRITALEGA